LLLAAACRAPSTDMGGGQFTTQVQFSSFSAVQPNTRVVMSNAVSETMAGTFTGNLSNFDVQGTAAPVLSTTGSSQTLTYDENTALSALSFTTPASTVTFNTANTGSTLICTNGVCNAQSASGVAVIIDGTAPTPGWNYQTFGVWAQITSSSTFQAGVISAGVPTPGNAIPTTGAATFTGLANGFFVPNVGGIPGLGFMTSANMTANVDFVARSIGFSTTNSLQMPLGSTAGTLNSALDMTGTLTYAPAVNSFSGTVNTAANGMTGTATGRFYGPAAAEIGGTFHLSGPTGVLLGGFGGKQ
jgi:hypothetical protein